MKDLLNIVQKSIVWDYYRKNTLFLLAVVLFAFGFLRGQEHFTIVKQVIGSANLLFLTFLLWFLYGLKIYLFVLRSLSQPEFRFLFVFAQIDAWKRILVLFLLMFLLNQLTFLYSIFMVIVGLLQGNLLSSFIILGFQIILILLGVIIIDNRINQVPERNFKIILGVPRLFQLSTPFFLFYHKFLIQKEPILLLLTKVFSIFSILFFIWLYPTDDYDFRLFGIAGVLIAFAHIRICNQWVEFHYQSLGFFQNLPLSWFFKISLVLFSYLILLIPEIYLIIFRMSYYVGITNAFSLLFFILSLLVAIHYFRYVNSMSDERKLQVYYFAGLITTIIIMYKVPISLLSVSCFSISFFIFHKFERKFCLSD